MSSRYRDSGVDIDAASKAGGLISGLVKKTWNENVLSEIGNFGGLYAVPPGLEDPVLVSSSDGVGTKLRIAFMTGKHDSVGRDLVNHCVNDILVQGAEPLFFLDYFACGKLYPETVNDVVRGLSAACLENGCALIGGETAEMPGFYANGEYDLAGCIVGVVERSMLIDGKKISPGDEVWAYPSSGLHTNGYSLARKVIFEDAGLGIDDELPGTGKTVAGELLEVHRSYLPEVLTLRKTVEVKGLAHITGGGLVDNIPRILPGGCGIEIDTGSWEVPPVFRYLQEAGGIEKAEMYRVFNMGVGMAVVVSGDEGGEVASAEGRWRPFRIGRVVTGDPRVEIS